MLINAVLETAHAARIGRVKIQTHPVMTVRGFVISRGISGFRHAIKTRRWWREWVETWDPIAGKVANPFGYIMGYKVGQSWLIFGDI